MTSTPSHNDNKQTRGPETQDANFKSVLLSGIGLMGILVVGLVLSWIVYAIVVKDRVNAPPTTFAVPDTTKLPAAPRLQPDPHVVLVAMRREEDSILTSYGWVDRDSGIVRLPVERAMEMLAQKGLPSRGDAKAETEGK